MIKMVHKASDVYGVSRDLPLSYTERKSVDDAFVSSLSLDKHVIVYGSSKQGKTCLRRHCLNDDEYILIQCQNGWKLDKLAESILKEAGYSVRVSSERTVENRFKLIASFKTALGAIGLGAVKSEASGEAERSQSESHTTKEIEIDPADPNDLVAALKETGFSRYIVLEDFHYLPHETQEDFAVFLKTIHERSSFCFVLVAVWREENRIIVFNGDLAGRVISVDADRWTDDELKQVIQSGESLLNIDVPDTFTDAAIALSRGSVFILQECCRRLCEEHKVLETCQQHRVLDAAQPAHHYIGEIVNEFGPRYLSFLHTFAEGFQSTRLDMYRWLLYPILTVPVDRLEEGLTYQKVLDILVGVHPAGASNNNNVSVALRSVPALQAAKKMRPFVLDYDQTNRLLSIVDRGFLIWLQAQDTRQLLDDLKLPR